MDLSPLEPQGNPLSLLHEPWLRARERVRCEIFQESEDISKVVAGEIAGLIRLKQAKGKTGWDSMSALWAGCGMRGML